MKQLTRALLVFVLVLCTIFTSVIPAYAYGFDELEEENRNEPPSADEMPISSSVWIEEEVEDIEKTIVNGEVIINKVPNYYQNYYHYSYIPYGKGTLETSGCGITCMAMVATYLLDDPEMTPDILAMEFGDYPGTNMDRMEHASETLGIPYTKTFDWDLVIDSLLDDKIVIVMVNEETKFTEIQHFILLTGLTNEGRLLINDPNWWNHQRMAKEFERGFAQFEVTKGFQGAWIFEK